MGARERRRDALRARRLPFSLAERGNARFDETHADLPDFDPRLVIPALVAAMHAHWRKKRSKTKAPNFVRVNEIPVRVKAGRNDPCPCGSGAKYKRCCGRGGASPPAG